MFSRTDEERFLWLSALYRIADVQVVDARYKPSREISQMYSF